MVACLVDKAFFQVYEDLSKFATFFNADNLETKYYYHRWFTMAYSCLVNAVAFIVGSDADSDDTLETFDVTYDLADGITSSNKRSKVTEGSKFSTTLSGTITTVTVEMGGVEQDDVYDSDTGKISIASVTGALEITAV